jgi:Uma2 family endonuclease
MIDATRTWNYEAYTSLPDDGHRYEVVDGVLLRSPSPTPFHQDVSKWLTVYLGMFVDLQGLGKVYSAPLDVLLPAGHTVQPDIFVILNQGNGLAVRDDKKISGAPDLIIEIASPGTSSYDRLQKFHLYKKAGVTEYWMVNLFHQSVDAYLLKGDDYACLGHFCDTDCVPSQVIPAMQQVEVRRFFQ